MPGARRPAGMSLPMAQEIAHYGAVTVLCLTGEFPAIQYLYDRLSILDSKASGLLSVNAILAAAVTILVFRDSGSASSGSLGGWESVLWLIAFGLLIVSSAMCASILYLRFDRITEDRSPPASKVRPLNCTCSDTICDLTCEYHRALVIIEHPPRSPWRAQHCATRSLFSYKQKFFELTMARERAYRQALVLMAISGAITASLVLILVLPALFSHTKANTQPIIRPTPQTHKATKTAMHEHVAQIELAVTLENLRYLNI
jgi:hypothetical protein